MRNSRLMFAALLLGATCLAAPAAKSASLLDNGIVVAADDAAPADAAPDEGDAGSAKMGEGAGTQTGDDQGATPENDTQKIDQPARRNETTTDPAGDEGDAGK